METDFEVVPRMAHSWWLSCMAWAAAMGGFIYEIVGSAVTDRAGTPVMFGVLIVPPVLLIGLSAYEWWTARRYGRVLSRLHLIGVGLGSLLWLLYPKTPDGSFGPSAASLCAYAGQAGIPECLRRADIARAHNDLIWWSTGALILVWALLARRSRTAAWSSAAVALAGSALALHTLETFLRSYNA